MLHFACQGVVVVPLVDDPWYVVDADITVVVICLLRIKEH